MTMEASLFDLSPLLNVMLVGLILAVGPLLWVYLRNRGASPVGRLQALTLVTLFLTFDLVLFGAFTRLTDSGLGCPDWPGCYGSASPVGAKDEIMAAQTAMPTGPVTHSKAWIEMVHRYLATGVGVLIIVLTVASWVARKARGAAFTPNPWWPTVTLVWVCIQGAFGALTVTMKLFPAIVSLHLLGGLLLLALLAAQAGALRLREVGGASVYLPGSLRKALWFVFALLIAQAASGAWVSTNYAVLACAEFPQCQGSWWPAMNFAQGFDFWRPLGLTASGEHISFQALTAIHMAHRMMALVTLLALVILVAALWRFTALQKAARWMLGLLILQAVTGISNVVLGWPLFAAVLHTGGAAAMVTLTVWLIATTRAQSKTERAQVFSRSVTE